MYIGRWVAWKVWFKSCPFSFSLLGFKPWFNSFKPLLKDLYYNLKFAYRYTITQHGVGQQTIKEYFDLRKGEEYNRKNLVGFGDIINYYGHLYKRIK